MRATTAIIFILIPVLSGCSSNPEKPPPEKPVAEAAPAHPANVQLNLMASDQINPDLNGRPSPVVIRIYELKSLGKFEAADFYKLSENYESYLGSELVGSEQYYLKPGDVNVIKQPLSADTRYVAVSAAFRDINKAVWKDKLELTDEKITDLLVFIEKLKTSIWKK
ncbi:MAG: type VI secretion system lipoprotein TssJ [Methylococcales bacterium]|nr:type VI secretion system lipoprotein TssJ [Methylococcales bacterium]